MTISKFTFDQIREDLHEALKQWAKGSATDCSLDYLMHYQHILQQVNGRSAQAIEQMLTDLLTLLGTENEHSANILQDRFVNDMTVEATTHKRGISHATLYNLQRTAIDRLAELLYQQELTARDHRRYEMEQLLEPPTYTALVGVDATLERLLEQLLQPTGPWLLALEGMGGLGKTSLANALMRRVIADPTPFVNIGWVTARQSHFDPIGSIVAATRPALTSSALVEALWQQLFATEASDRPFSYDQKRAMLHTRLREQSHLIVIDNLETLTDVRELLPLLQQLHTPTKFLLTSRERVGGVGIFHFTVPALSEIDTLQLIRQEAALANFPALADATDAELRPIYAAVGGNPLAIRLVVGQTYTQPLATILEDLLAARGAKVEQLYTYLYRRAWEQLDDAARDVWLTMPLITAGSATVSYLARQTQLDELAVRTALDQLAALNLINCHGDLHERRFTIHNLTRTFLIDRIARWGS